MHAIELNTIIINCICRFFIIIETYMLDENIIGNIL